MCCHWQHGVAGRWHKRVAERGQVGLEVLAGGLDGCQHQSDKLSGTYERSGCGSDTIMAMPTSKRLVHSASHTACTHASAKVSTLPCQHAGCPSAVPHSADHSLHTMTSFRRSCGKSGLERKWRADAENNGSSLFLHDASHVLPKLHRDSKQNFTQLSDASASSAARGCVVRGIIRMSCPQTQVIMDQGSCPKKRRPCRAHVESLELLL